MKIKYWRRFIEFYWYSVYSEFSWDRLINETIISNSSREYKKLFNKNGFIGEWMLCSSIWINPKKSSLRTAIRKIRNLIKKHNIKSDCKITISNMFVWIPDIEYKF